MIVCVRRRRGGGSPIVVCLLLLGLILRHADPFFLPSSCCRRHQQRQQAQTTVSSPPNLFRSTSAYSLPFLRRPSYSYSSKPALYSTAASDDDDDDIVSEEEDLNEDDDEEEDEDDEEEDEEILAEIVEDDDEDDEDDGEDVILATDEDDKDMGGDGVDVEGIDLESVVEDELLDEMIVEETVGAVAQQDDDDDDDEEYDPDAFYNYTLPWDDPWDEEVDGVEYELEDDPDDPDYTRQMELTRQAIADSEQRAADEAFDPLDFIANNMTSEMARTLDESPFFQKVEEISKDMVLTEEDVADIDLEKDLAATPDLMEDDPYDNQGETDIFGTGVTDDDMEELDNVYKDIREVVQKEPWDKVMLKSLTGWDDLDEETEEEIYNCLGDDEMQGSAYNVSNWLLYDLDFNVSNLILAAVKHNRDAPVLFKHWYPQLVTYKRYQHARDRNFDFTWDDVENADMDELKRYYAGFGYDEIPLKAPGETGIISLEYLDEDEIKMAAFENWIKDVYNPEEDRKDFDDDSMRDEDNVFSEFYEPPQHPDLPTFEDAVEDIEVERYYTGGPDWNVTAEVKEYRDMMGRTFEYELVEDEEFEREFRGHLIVACTGQEKDLDIAEKITMRFAKEFGKKVYVETRVMALAREEDNVFEIWLESYEIDLLHSKKRATSAGTKGWSGPAEVDDAQIDWLTERVRFLISDDARYSYRMDMDHAE